MGRVFVGYIYGEAHACIVFPPRLPVCHVAVIATLSELYIKTRGCLLSDSLSRPRAGQNELAVAEDFDQIRAAMEKCPPYQAIFSKVRRRLPVGAVAPERAIAHPCLEPIPQ